MAGDWIPMRLDLHEDPAVIAVAGALNLHPLDVCGRLYRLWGWANHQTADGHASRVTEEWVDHVVAVTGFAAALVREGWLEVDDTGITIPKFDKWNSQSAKTRILGTKRKQSERSRSRRDDGVTKPRPEKRREERIPPYPPSEWSEALAAAIAEATGTDRVTNSRAITQAVATLLKAQPPYTPEEVREFKRAFWFYCPYARERNKTPTPNEIVKNIGKVRSDPRRPKPGPAPIGDVIPRTRVGMVT